MVDYKKNLNISDDASEAEVNQAIDLLIKINQIRSKLPHQRVRSFSKYSLMVLYEARGLDPENITISSDDTLPSDKPEDEIINDCWRHLKDENLQDALDCAQTATEKYGTNPETWFVSGNIKSFFGEHEDAIYELKKAIKLKPSNSVYHFEIGAVYEIQGKLDSAIDEYVKAAKLSPETTVYRYAVGNILLQAKKYEDAISALEKCVNEEPAIELYQETLAASYNDIAISDWVQNPNGDIRCVTENSAQRAIEYLNKAEKLKHNNTEVKKFIETNLSVAEWALEKHWGRSIGEALKGGAGAVIFGVIIGLVIENFVGSFLGIIAIVVIVAAWIAIGFKPGWKINEEVVAALRIEQEVRQEM